MIFKGKFIKDEKGEIISHSIWFKVLLNPLFRKFGFHIVSKIDEKTKKILGYGFFRYDPTVDI